MADLLKRFMALLIRSLSLRAPPVYFIGKKIEDVGPILPSRRLVFATAICLIALSVLSATLLLCVILLGEAPPELVSAIVGLVSTIVGIYMGRRW